MSRWCPHCERPGYHLKWCRYWEKGLSRFLRDQMLDRLGANLAAAGALCAAYWEGWEQREHHDLYGQHGYRVDEGWQPNASGSPMPGWSP